MQRKIQEFLPLIGLLLALGVSGTVRAEQLAAVDPARRRAERARGAAGARGGAEAHQRGGAGRDWPRYRPRGGQDGRGRGRRIRQRQQRRRSAGLGGRGARRYARERAGGRQRCIGAGQQRMSTRRSKATSWPCSAMSNSVRARKWAGTSSASAVRVQQGSGRDRAWGVPEHPAGRRAAAAGPAPVGAALPAARASARLRAGSRLGLDARARLPRALRAAGAAREPRGGSLRRDAEIATGTDAAGVDPGRAADASAVRAARDHGDRPGRRALPRARADGGDAVRQGCGARLPRPVDAARPRSR